MTLEVIIGLSLIVVVPLVVIWLCYITDSLNSLIYNNRYNKYKIYHDADDRYYCEMVTNYIWYEDNSEIIRVEMNKSYIEYRKRNGKLKNKAEVVYKSYE